MEKISAKICRDLVESFEIDNEVEFFESILEDCKTMAALGGTSISLSRKINNRISSKLLKRGFFIEIDRTKTIIFW
jgi:hypothetical protein